MKLTIITVGKKHDNKIAEAIEDYTERLKSDVKLEWLLVSQNRSTTPQVCREQESKLILSQIKKNDFVVLLDETGAQLTSLEFAEVVKGWQYEGVKRVVIVIGGAYGVDTPLFDRADLTMALSKLVFPHQVVRLLIIEQLYRAFAILKKHPYHHE